MTEIEAKILSTLAFEPKLRIHAFQLEENYFESREAKKIFKIVLDNINEEPADVFLKLIESGVPPSFMDNVERESFFLHMLSILQNDAKKRMTVKRLSSLIEELNSDGVKLKDAGDELTKLSNMIQYNNEVEYKNMEKAGNELISSLQEIWDPNNYTLALPFLSNLAADLYGGEFITIAGRPGMGKTAVMLNMARVLAKNGTPIGFLSLEMKTNALLLRLVQKDWEKSLKYTLKYFTAAEKSKLVSDIENLKALPIHYNDKVDSDLGGLLSSVYMMARAEGCKVIFIDYLQLMPTNRHDSRNNEIAEITRRLKLLAIDLNIIIVAGSQLSRGVEQRESKKPCLSDLRDSGAIEQDTDMVIFCYRPGYYSQQEDPEKLILIVAKQRDGITGEKEVRFQLNKQLVTEVK